MASTPDIERWLTLTPRSEVWSAIDRVECHASAKCRAKNAAAKFVGDNPRRLRLEQLWGVGSVVVNVLRRAMNQAGGSPSVESMVQALRDERKRREDVAKRLEAAEGLLERVFKSGTSHHLLDEIHAFLTGRAG